MSQVKRSSVADGMSTDERQHGETDAPRQTDGFDATDRQIDRLVYDLYGLTDEEIRIVEEAAQ